jgi:hypothetical protein
VHRAQFTAAVQLSWAEKKECHATPMAAFLQMVLMTRRQLDGGDVKLLEIRNFCDNERVPAARCTVEAGAGIVVTLRLAQVLWGNCEP